LLCAASPAVLCSAATGCPAGPDGGGRSPSDSSPRWRAATGGRWPRKTTCGRRKAVRRPVTRPQARRAARSAERPAAAGNLHEPLCRLPVAGELGHAVCRAPAARCGHDRAHATQVVRARRRRWQGGWRPSQRPRDSTPASAP
jgi:hypothetical protein